ncbi:phosphatase PAP2 family protein [Streptomyces sp. NPDC048362]|uniref:phosphatase PAP2 family protein n=1 Tax=Streptomyces sp. NPDC048362 TaxID=3365539 RepID=UPI003722079D
MSITPASTQAVRRSRLVPSLLGIPAIVMVLITWQVVSHGPLLNFDALVSRALMHPDRFSELLSALGDVQIAVPVFAFAAGYTAWRGWICGLSRWWAPPSVAATQMAVLPAIVVPLKDWTARPGTAAVPPGVGYFPSGHTATAAIAYGCLALLLLPWLRSPTARRATVGMCAALVLAVSYGLVRRGWHWPLDVVASWCICTVLLTILALTISRSMTRRSGDGASITSDARGYSV